MLSIILCDKLTSFHLHEHAYKIKSNQNFYEKRIFYQVSGMKHFNSFCRHIVLYVQFIKLLINKVYVIVLNLEREGKLYIYTLKKLKYLVKCVCI